MKQTSAASTKQKHPPGLYVLFLTEMWERFSYYGMRAILVLYLVTTTAKGGLGWSEQDAAHLYGWYTGLVFLTPLIGGWLADRWLGTHRSMLIGGAIIAAGHFTLTLPVAMAFYLGLILIVIGTGFFKPCVSTMVGHLYGEDDPRRDAGFTIFYMGINLGALLGTLLCGYLGESERFGWHYGFGAAGVGMVAGLIGYVILRHKYIPPDIGAPPKKVRTQKAERASRAPLTAEERKNVLVILIAAVFTIFFWMAFEQAGSSMNLFAMRFTDRTFFGIEAPASWFQSINSTAILILAPVFAAGWLRLGARGKEPSTTVKMALGMLLLAAGFVAMVAGSLAARDGQLVSPLWLTLAYVLHTCGELCLSPVGLSLVTKLAPPRYASLLMGIWFLSSAAANLIAGYLAGAQKMIEDGQVFHIFGGMADFYLMFVATSLLAGLIMLALTPKLKLLMAHHEGRA
ncbi:MAG: peptide MFS transporter [Proteobacteria bacterium]|jgi:POT family proton-dependent oligopeptide transporter|nr:peptide MFS transporter [Pseudomonadota bacterium]